MTQPGHSDIPPLGNERDDHRRCARVVAGRIRTSDEQICGAPAVVHVIYDWEAEDWNHGYACAAHWAEYRQRWRFAFAHELGSACGMPGSVVDQALNCCYFDDLPVVEPVRAVAEAVTG